MRYVVVWARAKFVVDGERVVVTKGHHVPAGVDETVLHQLVLSGAIVAASPPAVSPEAAAQVDPADPGEIERPKKGDKVELWRAWAAQVGVVDLDGLKKDAIIEAVEAREAELEVERAALSGSPAPTPETVRDESTGPAGDPDAPTIS